MSAPTPQSRYEGRARWVSENGEWSLRFDPPPVIPANHRGHGQLPPYPFDADPAENQPWHPITIEFEPNEIALGRRGALYMPSWGIVE